MKRVLYPDTLIKSLLLNNLIKKLFFFLFFLLSIAYFKKTSLIQIQAQSTKPIALQDYLIGNFNPAKSKQFKLIPKKYAVKKIYLTKETLSAFLKMAQAANRDGVKLKIVSGFRSFGDQKRIWNRKYKSLIHKNSKNQAIVNNILFYSSYPGTSRHHWGSDIDINSLNNNYFTRTTRGKKTHAWLSNHANRYGFYLTYTPSFQRTGYKTELWHYSYYPVASTIMHNYLLHITPHTIKTLNNQPSVNLKKIFNEYILGINPIILKKMNLDGLLIKAEY